MAVSHKATVGVTGLINGSIDSLSNSAIKCMPHWLLTLTPLEPMESCVGVVFLRSSLRWLVNVEVNFTDSTDYAVCSVDINTCILPIFLCGFECCAAIKTYVLRIDALDQWCLWKLLGIKWYHHVQNDEVRWATKQARHMDYCLSLFGHIARMPDETDTKKIITASPWRTGGDHLAALVLHGWRLSSRIPNPPNSPWMNQLMWLRIVHSGDWCLRLVRHFPGGICQKWMNEWMNEC